MKELAKLLSFRVLPGVLIGTLLSAGLAPSSAAAKQRPTLLSFAIGAFDVAGDDENGNRGGRATEARIEFRSGWSYWRIQPLAGLALTSDGAGFAYGGVFMDFALSGDFYFTPAWAVGGFLRGDGKDLGHGLLFRTQLELSYRFKSGARFGLALSHISNGGLGPQNPGSESLMITYALPLTALAIW